MFYDAEKLIDFCSKKKITTEQFLFCYLTYKKDFTNLYKYCEEVRRIPGLKELEAKGYITNLNKGDETYPDNYIINKKFLKDFRTDLGEEVDELWEACPSNFTVGGKLYNAQTISPEELEDLYAKKLRKKGVTHEQVLRAFKEQVENGTLNMGLKKWLETEQWRREDNTLDYDYDL